MRGFTATVGGEGAMKLYELGTQLQLIAGVALFLGALRLFLANRTTPRLLLLVGTGMFAVGIALTSLQLLGALELNYTPGWKEQLVYPVEILGLDPDDPFLDPTPAWWEGVVWWGERILGFLGMMLAAVGFFLDARSLAGSSGPRRRRAA